MSGGDIQRLGTYLGATEINSPYSEFDLLETRGASWELLRYAADRRGGLERDTWRALVNSTTAGQANFAAVFGRFTDIVHDWAEAQFTDDAGLFVSAFDLYPSWNFRSVFAADDEYGVWPLAMRSLPGGAPANLILVGGGVGYLQFRVGSGVIASVTSASLGNPVSAAVTYTLTRTR
jgi:hypothetical protein